jgi:hypothetical protein
MKAGLFPFWLLACAGWIVASGLVHAEAARIAVAGDASLANLIDVTTGELSKLPELSVLDRADLNKLGQEQQIQAVLNTQDFTAIHLLPADGLVLLRAVTLNGKTGVFARLVAVQPGVALREVALPDGADPVTQAQALEKEFAAYWPKLTALQKSKINALSLLGLRFEVDAPETRDQERRMNLLLASRLSAEPDVLVLERWRLNDAVFEKSLAPPQPSPYWTGSSLIDGSMRLQNGLIEVTLRLRPSQGAEISITDQDTPENLPALAGRLADKIQNHPMAQDAWKPAPEAAHYAELGKWCLDNRLYDEGAQALESALALGDTARTTRMEQVEAYAIQAYPDDLRVANTDYNKAIVQIAPDSLSQRLAAATRAAELSREYLEANRDFSSLKWNLEDPFDLSAPVLNNCLRTLRAAYENNYQRDHGNEVAEARHEVQKLIAAMEEFLHVKSAREDYYFRLYQIRYAGLWHETPEETLAYYRELLNRKTDGSAIRVELFHDGLAPPYLDGEGEAALTAPWSVKSPRMVAWDGRSDDELKTIWRDFLKELAASPDPVLQADALKFEFCSNRTKAGRNDVATRIVAFLKQHPENIYGPRGEDFTAGFSVSLSLAHSLAACSNDLLDLYATLFRQHVALPSNWIFAASNIIDPQMPTEPIKNLLAALNDYTQWYQSQPQDYPTAQALARARQTIYNSKPELMPAVIPVANALSVPEAWDNQDKVASPDGLEKPRPLLINFRTFICAENKFWFMTNDSPRKVMCLDPANWQIISSDAVPPQFEPPKHSPLEMRARYLAITPQWLVFAYAGQVLLCSRADHQWHALDLPPSTYKPCWVNQELYLLYEAEYGAVLERLTNNGAASIGSGLIRVSLPEGKIENLISSRRVPPQNALEGKDFGRPIDLWMSQAGLTLAINGGTPHFQVYASPVGKNDWTSVATDPMPCQVRTMANGAVIGHGFSSLSFSAITLINDKGNAVLLANPDMADVNGAVKPLWNFPDDLRTAPPGVRSEFHFLMRGDDLCLCHSTRGDTGVANASTATLYYFAKGQKVGIKIPLAFDVSQIKGPGALIIGSLEATDHDLIFSANQNSQQGFWAIPWSEIDAYLRTNAR